MTAKDDISQERNRERFFETAEPLFERHGFRKTTVQDICRAAGFSKPTFYNLFKDKTEFFSMLLVHISENELEKWKAVLPGEVTPLDRLLSFIDFYVDSFVPRLIFQRVFEDPEIMEKFARIISHSPDSPVLSTLREVIHDGVDAGQFRRLDPDAVVWMIYAVLDSMYLLYPLLTGTQSADECARLGEEVKQFILKGTGARDETS